MSQQPGKVLLDGPGEDGGYLVLDVLAGGYPKDVIHFFEGGGFRGAWEEEPDEDGCGGVKTTTSEINQVSVFSRLIAALGETYANSFRRSGIPIIIVTGFTVIARMPASRKVTPQENDMPTSDMSVRNRCVGKLHLYTYG